MPNWNKTIHLKDLLHDPEQDIEELTKEVIGRMKCCLPVETDIDLIDIVEMFKEAVDVESFDWALAEFYDYADRERVWVA